MTHVNQHHMPLEHVIDNAEKAIQVAKDAEMAVRHAQLDSNPEQFAKASAQLKTAQKAVAQAKSQLNVQNDEQHQQEVEQVADQLLQAAQGLDIVASNLEMPRQIR